MDCTKDLRPARTALTTSICFCTQFGGMPAADRQRTAQKSTVSSASTMNPSRLVCNVDESSGEDVRSGGAKTSRSHAEAKAWANAKEKSNSTKPKTKYTLVLIFLFSISHFLAYKTGTLSQLRYNSERAQAESTSGEANTALIVSGIEANFNTLSDPGLGCSLSDVKEFAIEAVRQALSDSARYNYASVNHGARIDHGLTSDTYHPTPTSFTFLEPWYPLCRRWGLMDRGQAPEIALQLSTEPDECWPVRGSAGTLAVKLGYDVYIEGIAVDHVSRDFAFDRSVAPKHVQLWGLVSEDSYQQSAEEIDESKLAMREGLRLDKQDHRALLLADFVYDANAQKSLQTFTVFSAVQNLDVTFNEVLVEILSNWGSFESTCLYNVRISGRRVYNHLYYE